MDILADLQLHSRFSRAVSSNMTIPFIASWAVQKGIDLVATGDWTHPNWFREIEANLEETGTGLLRLKSQIPSTKSQTISKFETNPLFLLATEVSCIYSQGGKVRRVHTLIWVPTLSSARRIAQEMTKRGCNLLSDGRPIIGLSSVEVAELVFGIEPDALIIPAHAWTPWFSVYGSLGGFDSINEAFGRYADRIYAIETGLSSNPSMNWRVGELDSRSIVSFSDAHSGAKLGREATVFRVPTLTYGEISNAIRNRGEGSILYTIEFYPEEGKYHYNGHRSCLVRQTPAETKALGLSCPVCGKPVTVGVMHRVSALATRSEEEVGMHVIPPVDSTIKATMYGSTTFPKRPPFVMLVPLLEIIREALGVKSVSKKVLSLYTALTDRVGTEFDILLRSELTSIARVAGERVATGIERVRRGDIHIDPGYDGVFGVVTLWPKEQGSIASDEKQLPLL